MCNCSFGYSYNIGKMIEFFGECHIFFVPPQKRRLQLDESHSFEKDNPGHNYSELLLLVGKTPYMVGLG